MKTSKSVSSINSDGLTEKSKTSKSIQLKDFSLFFNFLHYINSLFALKKIRNPRAHTNCMMSYKFLRFFSFKKIKVRFLLLSTHVPTKSVHLNVKYLNPKGMREFQSSIEFSMKSVPIKLTMNYCIRQDTATSMSKCFAYK